MSMKLTVDGMEISNTILDKKNSIYEETRRRLINYSSYYRMASDKEIIEYLAEEIEEYRNKIRCLEIQLNETRDKEIKSDVVILNTTDKLLDDNIESIVTDTIYADGKIAQITTRYKYREEKNNSGKSQVLQTTIQTY